ncbi:MAG: hypothetical protein KDE14_00180 [Rhodobacteraceae bacterium]|nr:hypothetical protein [Paracoccaceae bacterium]
MNRRRVFRAARAIAAIFAIGIAPLGVVAGEVPSAIGSFESDMGTHYTTADGFTLYVYDNDNALASVCEGGCTGRWPPLAAPGDAEPTGEWTPFTRSDGARQWAFRGRPVYRNEDDRKPGATVGDGVQNVWHVAIDLKPRPPGMLYTGTVLGRVITGPNRMSLYTKADNTCTGDCLRDWVPFAAPWSARDAGDWSVVTRSDDGTRQWAWKGKWLFAYRGDPKPGETRGHRVGGVWQAALIQPTPELPPWVTVVPSDYGPIFANDQGKTLYYVSDDMLDKIAVEGMCDDACKAEHWTIVVAAPDAVPVGNWSLEPLPDGRKQWAYRGRRLSTFNRDSAPGEIYGDRFAGGGGFNSGWLVIPQLTLREETL